MLAQEALWPVKEALGPVKEALWPTQEALWPTQEALCSAQVLWPAHEALCPVQEALWSVEEALSRHRRPSGEALGLARKALWLQTGGPLSGTGPLAGQEAL